MSRITHLKWIRYGANRVTVIKGIRGTVAYIRVPWDQPLPRVARRPSA